MKQIGNLAVVCARRQDVLLQVGSEKVCVHVGAGPERNTLHAAWDGLHTAQQDCPVGRGKEKSA